MDILFCNDFADNLPLTIELNTSVMLRNPNIYIINTLIILVILYLCFFTSDITRAVYLSLCFFYMLAADLYLFLRIKRYSKHSVDRGMELNSGGLSGTVMEVTSDVIRCKSYNGAFTEVPFYKIKKVFETEHLVVLQSKTANLYYTFKKDAFTKGSYTEFMEFLKQKGLYK